MGKLVLAFGGVGVNPLVRRDALRGLLGLAVRPDDDLATATAAFAATIASATKEAAPQAEPALPVRKRVALTTGALSRVDRVAVDGLSPRSRTSYPPIFVCPNAAAPPLQDQSLDDLF